MKYANIITSVFITALCEPIQQKFFFSNVVVFMLRIVVVFDIVRVVVVVILRVVVVVVIVSVFYVTGPILT